MVILILKKLSIFLIICSICTISSCSNTIYAYEDIDFEIVMEPGDMQIYKPVDPPRISVPAAVAIDTTNGRILFGKNAFTQRQMASTTKMMTAILAIENGNLSDQVKVSSRAARIRGSQAQLKEGEMLTLENLLYALMLPSGNDAAIAIAEHFGGSVENFITMMDAKARQVGAVNTKYGSPHGLDRENYSTAYDLAIIAKYCIQNSLFSKIVNTKSKVIPRAGMEDGKQYNNTNEMLRSYEGADGVKTGYTGPAGRCLVSSATRNDWRVVCVVLGANSKQQRHDESKKILDYCFGSFPLNTVLEKEQEVISIPVIKGTKEWAYIINKQELKMHIQDSELVKLDREFIVPKVITAPIKEGQTAGKLVFKLDDKEVGTSELFFKESILFRTVDVNFIRLINYLLKREFIK